MESNLKSSGGCLVTQSCLTLETPWTAACQATLSMEYPGKESWNGFFLESPSPVDLPDSKMGHMSPALRADSLPIES